MNIRSLIAVLCAVVCGACSTTGATEPTDRDRAWADATSVRPAAPPACDRVAGRPRLEPKDYSDTASWGAYWKLDAYTARLEGRHAACGTWARGKR